ncbi:hypothetical protein FRACYDRAFT_233732 [Fragilariopsis cylindrus CCMP1102]|uniref:DOMON domain-containing protein n=1 Tax=Fragilariopsis cylindrus CCMP1102 TaxID=635003 RepID=A0A1E7FZI9_9STRA|nr:hypothetical protein FRACYDRAFT_233732 [Fragilariopsis cylindrus CCMP1102]|eukprot:OEU23558.1 hypothetical protein FRACYDRAFT_233732 [Fragilariopsis cylindrus CCMP1102]
MKLSLTFLALAVTTVQADLTTKWNIDKVVATSEGDLYTFTYSGIGAEMALSNMRSNIIGGDCDGTTYASKGYGNADVKLNPVDDLTIDLDSGVATVEVDLNTKVAAEQTDLWTSDGTNGGGGILKYCLRYGLWAGVGAGVNEINFSETLVTVTITMEGGFEVSSIQVTEKAKETSSQAQAYTVNAALCDGTEGTDGEAGNAFLQGSLICVKVTPSSADVEISTIADFTWTNNADPAVATTQVALPNTDGLTSYVAGTDTFSTILYAQFYETGSQVTGSGTANLGFNAQVRRLGASGSEMNGRVLQLQDIDAVQEFDIVADIVKSDDNPTALQTAGGATASFVVTIVGLVGAVLLA